METIFSEKVVVVVVVISTITMQLKHFAFQSFQFFFLIVTMRIMVLRGGGSSKYKRQFVSSIFIAITKVMSNGCLHCWCERGQSKQ